MKTTAHGGLEEIVAEQMETIRELREELEATKELLTELGIDQDDFSSYRT